MPDSKPRLWPTSEAPQGEDAPVATTASPSQCRAGRAMLGLAQAEFARCAGVPCDALAEYERGRTQAATDMPRRITEALQAFGVALTDGDGVQLADSRVGRKAARVPVRASDALSLSDSPARPNAGRHLPIDVNPTARAAALGTRRRTVLRFRLVH